MDPVFLSLDEVLEIHEQQIDRYGGTQGLRDAAGLESAVATPQATSCRPLEGRPGRRPAAPIDNRCAGYQPAPQPRVGEASTWPTRIGEGRRQALCERSSPMDGTAGGVGVWRRSAVG